jgi:hypothetical protein
MPSHDATSAARMNQNARGTRYTVPALNAP